MDMKICVSAGALLRRERATVHLSSPTLRRVHQLVLGSGVRAAVDSDVLVVSGCAVHHHFRRHFVKNSRS